MKKILKSLVISMIILCSMTASIFATSAEDIRQKLLDVGVPSSYIGTLIEYLQKTTISDDDYDTVVAYIDEARGIMGDIKDISELSESDKLTIKNLATKAGNTIGLEVTFGRVDGITTLIINDTNGATVLQMATVDAMDSFENYHLSMHVELLADLVDYLKDTGNENIGNGNTGDENVGDYNSGSGNTVNGEFEPVGGELTQTATPYGNIMVAGACMIIVGTVLLKKQFA